MSKKIRWAAILCVPFLLWYVYSFLDTFWWSNKIPPQHPVENSKAISLGCLSDEVLDMFIPSLRPGKSNVVRDHSILAKTDARPLLLEKYTTITIGSEILQHRPDCLGAFIADKEHWPEAFVFLIVDRNSGLAIFRIARLQDHLTR